MVGRAGPLPAQGGFAAGLDPGHRPGEGAAARRDRTCSWSSALLLRRCSGGRGPDRAATSRGWWDEFEAGETAEARLAKAVDSLAPLIVNHASGGRLWRERGRTEADVRARNARMERWVPDLVPVVDALVDDAVRKGWL